MKKGLPILIALLLLSTIMVNAQSSKTYCTEMAGIAKKLAKKVKKKHVKKANALYPQAVKAIEKAKMDYPKEEFGNDKLVSEIPSWIRMYSALSKIEGNKVVDKKGNTFEFVIVDYKPLQEEVTLKAGEDHYKAGKELMESEDFEEIEKGFAHFKKAKMYVKTYKEEIDEIMVEKYYLEGVKYLNSSTLYSEKKKSIKYFKSALSIKKPYKDINELIAELYYVEGDRLLSEGETSAELKNGIGFFNSALKYKADYKDCKARITEALNAGAELAYVEAVELESEESFAGQEKASEAFKSISEWVVEYKDAEARAAAAEDRSVALVLVITENGEVLKDSPIKSMNNKFKKSFRIYNSYIKFDDLNGLDLNDEKNYPKATELSKRRFIYVKLGEREDGEFTDDGPKEVITDVITYSMTQKDKEEKFMTEKEYNTNKKLVEFSGTAEDLGIAFHIFKGKVTTVSESVSYKTNCIIEVLDARTPDSPFQVGTVKISKSFSDKRVIATYTGDDKAKPARLANDTHELLTEAQLKAKADKEDVSIKALLEEESYSGKRYIDVIEILEKNIEYMSY